MFGHLPHALHAPLPLILRRPTTGEVTERRVKWPNQILSAKCRRTINAAFVAVDPASTHVRVRADRVVLDVADRDRRTAKPEVAQSLGELFVFRHVIVEDRDLDPVIAEFRERFDRGKIRLGDIARPKQ